MSPLSTAFIDAVGFEAKGHDGGEQPAVVLNQAMDVTRYAGSIGIPGLVCDRGSGIARCASRERARFRLRFGLGWSKAHSFHTGQTPTLRYNRQLMQAILHDRLPIAKVVNAQVIPLDEAVTGYARVRQGRAAIKFVIDPHGLVAHAA